MPKQSMKSALGASLKAEATAVEKKFAAAESVFEKRQRPTPLPKKQVITSRVIRDSFTIPEDDYALIPELKQRCINAGASVTKSELLRAGLRALEEMSEKELLETVKGLMKVKVGRPAQSA
jgi:hypothetical protein